ncbi:MAG: MBL fold metallo-hydrolase [Cyclobacteriaceae bacterium]|nr:MBL fold metallo-hydrolase [Cyclobacteriaceae bacterium]
MNVRVKFLGAAGTVTGSKYLLETGDFNILIDCGLFQGLKANRLRNWDDFPVDVQKIDAVVITHAHLDHTGYLPRMVKNGFAGPVYCTEATADLMRIILLDAAKLQEEEAAYARKKGYSKHSHPEPLFETKHAEAALGLIRPVPLQKTFPIAERILINYVDAGHILGAATLQVEVHGPNQKKKITFTGDIGRYNDPILNDPQVFDDTDILFMESTYGNRNNPAADIEGQLEVMVNETFENGGCLLIPAFAVGRTQLLMYYFRKLLLAKKIPDVNIYVDSPMAISVTDLYRKYHYLHKLHDDDLSDPTHPVFDFKNIKYVRSHEDSYSINNIKSNAIIISASGMSTGGRILHHMYNRLPHPNDTLLLVGYQAEGTRGSRLQKGEKTIKIFGIEVDVKCQVKMLDGLSAHADQEELVKWMSQIKEKPKMTFFVHGERESAQALADKVSAEKGWNCYVPEYMESFALFNGI